jgi:D-xylose 1-dehydrogenase (NADP+, D-xylono-1,5-lactone-forming)
MADQPGSPLRWGVVGATSRIYQGKLKPAMLARQAHTVVAEASRTPDRSDAPYAELLARPDVDAVYIPLPNDGHKRWILAALEAGKHVLCEKPLTMSSADTDEVFAAANSAGRAVVEAYMWPHHPRSKVVLEVARTELGQLRISRGAFSFTLNRYDDHRFDDRGGGALFDVGIYCLGPAVMLAPRQPIGVAASAVRNDHGVDVSMSGWLDLGEGLCATAEASFESVSRRSLDLVGTEGALTIAPDLAPGPLEATVVEVLRLDDSIGRFPAEGADSFGEMLDQFAAVTRGEAPLWGESQSRLLAVWMDMLLAAAR